MSDFASVHPEPEDGPAPDRAADPRLFQGGLGLLAALIIYCVFNADVRSVLELYEGLGIIVLSALPSLLWARRAAFEFPVFEVFMLTGINIYAMPMLNGQGQIASYDESVMITAGAVVLLFQICAVFTHAVTRGHPLRTPFWTDEVISRDIGKYLGYGLVLTTIYTAITSLDDFIPSDIEGPLRAVFFGIGIISTFIQGRRWGQNGLSHGEKTFFTVNMVLQIVLSFATLYLISGLSVIVLALLGYVSGSKRLPVLLLAVILPVVAVLHNGKAAMREKYWENKHPMPGLTELPAFFAEWFHDGLDLKAKGGLTAKLIDRTSLFQMTCLVVAKSPDELPFLNGETYAQIPAQFVPRFFWPDKPTGHISTYTLSIYYGLQRPEDTEKTTIAFGLLAEAYANFGFFGAGFLGVFFAFAFKKFGCWARESPTFSYAGLLLVLLMAWSFQTELTLSIWLSSLFQATVTMLGVPFLMRHFLG